MGAKSNTPIIAMTAHATLEEENRCLENGMNDYLSKPFHFNVLLEKLYNNLMKTNTTVSSDLAAEKVESENLIDLTYLILLMEMLILLNKWYIYLYKTHPFHKIILKLIKQTTYKT
jgi:DNA-binding response OmpR family regulator